MVRADHLRPPLLPGHRHQLPRPHRAAQRRRYPGRGGVPDPAAGPGGADRAGRAELARSPRHQRHRRPHARRPARGHTQLSDRLAGLATPAWLARPCSQRPHVDPLPTLRPAVSRRQSRWARAAPAAAPLVGCQPASDSLEARPSTERNAAGPGVGRWRRLQARVASGSYCPERPAGSRLQRLQRAERRSAPTASRCRTTAAYVARTDTSV